MFRLAVRLLAISSTENTAMTTDAIMQGGMAYLCSVPGRLINPPTGVDMPIL